MARPKDEALGSTASQPHLLKVIPLTLETSRCGVQGPSSVFGTSPFIWATATQVSSSQILLFSTTLSGPHVLYAPSQRDWRRKSKITSAAVEKSTQLCIPVCFLLTKALCHFTIQIFTTCYLYKLCFISRLLKKWHLNLWQRELHDVSLGCFLQVPANILPSCEVRCLKLWQKGGSLKWIPSRLCLFTSTNFRLILKAPQQPVSPLKVTQLGSQILCIIVKRAVFPPVTNWRKGACSHRGRVCWAWILCVGFGAWKKVNAFKNDFPDNTWIRTLTSPASLAYQ